MLAAICLRELAALARLGRIETLRARAVEARETGSPAATEALLNAASTRSIAAGPTSPGAASGWPRPPPTRPMSPARLAIAEQTLMAPLDAAAEAAIMRASRDVATSTAMIPLALIDVPSR